MRGENNEKYWPLFFVRQNIFALNLMGVSKYFCYRLLLFVSEFHIANIPKNKKQRRATATGKKKRVKKNTIIKDAFKTK